MADVNNDLVNENLALRQEIEALKTTNQNTWNLLIDIVRRLQASSTSIKAAVSSLLSYDIFWDITNQHEFLRTIETSADQASSIESLLSLAFRMQAERLEVKPEPHSLQEILYKVDSDFCRQFPDFVIDLDIPVDGKPVQVDFEYLSITLTLIIQLVMSDTGRENIGLRAWEEANSWVVEFSGLNSQMVKYVYTSMDHPECGGPSELPLDPADNLRMKVICNLLSLQGLKLLPFSTNEEPTRLAFSIPVSQVI